MLDDVDVAVRSSFEDDRCVETLSICDDEFSDDEEDDEFVAVVVDCTQRKKNFRPDMNVRTVRQARVDDVVVCELVGIKLVWVDSLFLALVFPSLGFRKY